MSDQPSMPSNALRVDKRWLWAVRIAALTSVLLIATPLIVDIGFGGLLLALPFVAHYLLALWRLRVRAPKRERGLALSMGTGSATFLIAACLVMFLAPSQAWGRWPVSYFASLGLVQAVLVVTAIRTYCGLPREAGDRRWLWVVGFKYGLSYLLIFLVGFGMWAPSGLRSPVAANQAAAVGLLRTINTAAFTYKSNYANGFPPDLKALAPPSSDSPRSCAAAGLIDAALAVGEKRGYRFEYRRGPLVGRPPVGCAPGVTSYSIGARPLAYGKTGEVSYFTDETGVIRWTREDRPATAQDPPITG